MLAGHFTHIRGIPTGFCVSIFFVISGFLITWLLLSEFDKTDTIDLLAFHNKVGVGFIPMLLWTCLVVLLLRCIAVPTYDDTKAGR